MKVGYFRSKVGTRALKAGPLGASRLPGVKEKWPPMVPALVGERERRGGRMGIVRNLRQELRLLQCWMLRVMYVH